MGNNAQIGAGFLFIIIAVIIWMVALPSLTNNTGTATGQPLENSTAVIKSLISYYDIMFAIVPFILLGAGLVMVSKGL